MKPIHIPRSILIIILVAISLAFLFGTVRAFDSVHAYVPVTGGTLSGAAMFAAYDEPEPTDEPTVTPTALPTPPSADTTGTIVLAIVIVAVVLVGTAWGGRKLTSTKK